MFALKTIVAATAVASSAVALSGPADVIFKVSDFSAACIPHSSQCSYDFTVIKAGTSETAANGVVCSALVTSDGTLPAVADGTCEDSSRTWTVTKPETGGLVLTVSQPVTPSTSDEGGYYIPTEDLTTTTTGASTQQSYTGPTSFDLSA